MNTTQYTFTAVTPYLYPHFVPVSKTCHRYLRHTRDTIIIQLVIIHCTTHVKYYFKLSHHGS